MTFLVDSDDTTGQFVLCSSKDGVSRDTVHVQTLASLQVVQVDEAVLGNEVDDPVPFRDLHRNGEVVDSFGREKDVSGLFLEDRVGRIVVDLDDVQLVDDKSEERIS